MLWLAIWVILRLSLGRDVFFAQRRGAAKRTDAGGLLFLLWLVSTMQASRRVRNSMSVLEFTQRFSKVTFVISPHGMVILPVSFNTKRRPSAELSTAKDHRIFPISRMTSSSSSSLV